MRFSSPTETPIVLGLTSGHTCVIGPDLVDVPPRFHRLAVAEGAVPEGMDKQAPVLNVERTPTELVLDAVRKLVERAEPTDFGNDGRPKAPAISKLVGFTVNAEQRDKAWAVLEEEEQRGE